MSRGTITTIYAVTDATLDRLAHRFRRSWHTLAANNNEPMTYWSVLASALRRQTEEG